MATHYIYSYRLTHFGGAAPCYQSDLLSLAICKRDMRRVMGRRFLSDKSQGEDHVYWFIGIVGKGLSESIQDGTRDKPFAGREDSILYIAQLTDVITYGEYFSFPKYKDRMDQIYIVSSKNGCYESNGLHFMPKPNNGIHDTTFLHNRDWDTTHEKQEHYVLLSNSYAFMEKGFMLPDNTQLAAGVGHSWFGTDESNKIIPILNEAVKQPNHGIKNLPTCYKTGCNKGCGKDKG